MPTRNGFFIIAVVLTLLELLFLKLWHPFLFSSGMMVYSRFVACPCHDSVEEQVLELNANNGNGVFIPITFHAIDDFNIGFRESLGVHFSLRYISVVRGRIERSPDGYRLFHYLNFHPFLLLFILPSLARDFSVWYSAAVFLVVLVLIVLSYLVQLYRTKGIIERIRCAVRDGTIPVE